MRYYENLADYRRFVGIMVTRSDGTPINNSTEEHARVIIEQLFRQAKEKIDILSGSLNSNVYGSKEVVHAVNGFLEKREKENRSSALPRKPLRVIVEEDLEDYHPLLITCKPEPTINYVEFRKVPEDTKKRYNFHAVLVDGRSYRFEVDKTKPVGIAAFNDKLTSQHLGNIFQELWERSEPMQVGDYC